MATELTTVFLPVIDEARMSVYASGDFQLLARQGDSGVDIRFTPQEEGDKAVFMVAPGEVFFVNAGATVQFINGPLVTAPVDRNVVVVHILRTFEWSPILATTGQPVAEWWAFEGITTASFEAFLSTQDLSTLAPPRGYVDGAAYQAAILSGQASLNALLSDGSPAMLGSMEAATGTPVTLGVRAFASYDSGIAELDALSALATIGQLAPTLAPDPTLATIGQLAPTLAPDPAEGVAGHPVLAKVLAGIADLPVTIHIRFVYWKPRQTDVSPPLPLVNATSETDKGGFEPVPKNSKIALQKRSAGSIYTTLPHAEKTVDTDGQVALTVARADLQSVNLAAGEGLVFRVEVPNGTPNGTRFETQYQHNDEPREPPVMLKWGGIDNVWVTEGRSTTDDAIVNLDFLVSLASTTAGTAKQPIEYYAGIPIFLQIKYPLIYTAGSGSTAKFKPEIRKAPKGIKVEILDSLDLSLGTFRTDEHGQIWGMLALGGANVLPLVVKVTYHMEDRSIGLLPIEGEIVEGVNTFVNYSSGSDVNGTQFSVNSSLGKPSGSSTATALATMQVGSVTISGTADSEFSSTDGRHAGVIHALHQIRYIHQWFHYLTQGYSEGATDKSWDAILAAHDWGAGTANAGTINYSVLLPKVRVTLHKTYVDTDTGRTVIDETIRGEVDIDDVDLPNIRWWLILYGQESFKMNQKVMLRDKYGSVTYFDLAHAEDKPQFWRDFTIWHEFTHAVVNMALELLKNLDTYTSVNKQKDLSTSGRINQVIGDGWSTLSEAMPAIPEVALLGKASAIEPQFYPSSSASPRYVTAGIDTSGDGIADFSIPLNEGMTAPGVLDWRLGLRVPLAFTWGLWTALQRVGGFNKTLYKIFHGRPNGNDLKDKVHYLKSNDAKRIFQALVWGPLVGLRDAQDAGPPPQWDDLDGSHSGFIATDPEGKGAAGPPFGAHGSRRIRINGPSTHRFMELIQQDGWTTLNSAEQKVIKNLFGDVDDRGNKEEVSFYLWFDF